MSKSKKLNSKLMQLFVLEYIKDFNATQAAIRAGYKSDTAKQKAYGLLKDERIKQAIDEAIAERKERLHIDADNVLYKWWQIATADYNELTQLRRVNCRYCWGNEHEYQWTPKEYEKACHEAEINMAADPTNIGGLNFDANRPPHPDCPECNGNGVEQVYIADTTKLSPEANLIYQGVKQTKFGLEVTTVDRMKALDNVARHLGMFKETINHVSEDGSMSPEPAPDLSRLTDDELRQLAVITAKTKGNSGGTGQA